MLPGLAFATLLLNTAAAIVVYFASLPIPTIFVDRRGFLDWFKPTCSPGSTSRRPSSR